MIPDNPSSIESELAAMKPLALDPAFLDRLESCAEGTLITISPAEVAFEKSLRNLRPAAVPADLMSACEKAFEGLPFPVDEKIVLFPKAAARGQSSPRRSWAAAAAVALIGGVSALLMPRETRQVAQVRDPVSLAPAESAATGSRDFVPANFGGGVSEARDEGVIWKSKEKAHRVVRVVYMDRVTLRNADGKVVEVERPRVEYVLVPEKID